MSTFVQVACFIVLFVGLSTQQQLSPQALFQTVHYGDTNVASLSSASTQTEGDSWLITIEVPSLTKSAIDSLYNRFVKEVADSSPNTLCSMSVTLGPKRTRLSLACPADTNMITRIVADLEATYGSNKISFEENIGVQLHSSAHTSVVVKPRIASITQSGVRWGLDRIDSRARIYDNNYIMDDAGAGADVWVLDTGALETHNEFGGRAFWRFNTHDTNNVDCNGIISMISSSSFPPSLLSLIKHRLGHGTNVAGIVGGIKYGVAKGVILYIGKVLGCDGGGTIGTVTDGLDRVEAMRSPTRATVINLSLNSPKSQAFDNAVANLFAQGIAVTGAAGNSGSNACDFSPSGSAGFLAVAASDRTDRLADFSNFGPCARICAPGVSILAAWPSSNDATAALDGTSQAGPHVAGFIAMAWSLFPNKTAPAPVIQFVINKATPGVILNPRGASPPLLFSRLALVTVPPSPHRPPTKAGAAPLVPQPLALTNDIQNTLTIGAMQWMSIVLFIVSCWW